MAKNISIGRQDYAFLIENDYFYVDKTDFIKEWYESGDEVTLITRPRRFGKTLNMSMMNYFFSLVHAGRRDLFESLSIWKTEKYQRLQGTYPVIFLSFAGIKGTDFKSAYIQFCRVIYELYNHYSYLTDTSSEPIGKTMPDKPGVLSESERADYNSVLDALRVGMDGDDDLHNLDTVAFSIHVLSEYLYQYHGKKVLIILDEYDTPMQEAYVNGYWDEMVSFIRIMFNNAFKTNRSLERAIITGVTRISKESIFSDINNLTVVTTTSDKYATSFGFTEEEVFAALDQQGYNEDDKVKVKQWYDGFTFGKIKDIYNPWSITGYLEEGKLKTYWANTSSNSLIGTLIKTGDKKLKMEFEDILDGKTVCSTIDEQIIFNQLDDDQSAIWSLLLASGYVKVISLKQYDDTDGDANLTYELALTNHEVKTMFKKMISGWFKKDSSMSEFVSSMLSGNVLDMNRYMNRVALNTFSYFDSGSKPSVDAPERFYHGFVLGLLVDNAKDYIITSNRESGYGRYDVVMEPRNTSSQKYPGVILEFKVHDELDGEKQLSDTADNALKQIEEKNYAADLIYRGVPEGNILKYGLAFKGSECLIKKG